VQATAASRSKPELAGDSGKRSRLSVVSQVCRWLDASCSAPELAGDSGKRSRLSVVSQVCRWLDASCSAPELAGDSGERSRLSVVESSVQATGGLHWLGTATVGAYTSLSVTSSVQAKCGRGHDDGECLLGEASVEDAEESSTFKCHSSE